LTRPTDETLLAFLEETLDDEARAKVAEQLEADPELAAELERAAAALEALRSAPVATPADGRHGRITPWWVAVASVTTLAIAIPTTLHLAGESERLPVLDGLPDSNAAEPSGSEFVLVLRNSWTDDGQLEPDERQKREDELAEWTSQLAADGLLVSASDLALERGMRFGSSETAEDAHYIAAVITLRTDDDQAVTEIARSSPNLGYGGSVTVRRVGVAPQATSLLGEELYAREDSTGEIAAADAVLAQAPDDVELLLAAGRARWGSWQYRQAVAMYTRAMDVAPDDWRLYMARGNRRFALREIDGSIADLERARELAPLNYDVAYYLGFAYFLDGRFEYAADEYMRCFKLADDPTSKAAQAYDFRSCSQIADDVGWRIAITDWAIRALRRAARHDEAMELLDTVTPGMPVEAYRNYYNTLLFYKGHITAEELLSVSKNDPYDFETVAYGVANWYLIEGETDRAVELLEEIAASPRWPAYGRIAAEAELARLTLQ